jgi:hypothetical protein
VNNKYCPKGEIYSNTIYETLKNLALLDWNNRKQKIPAINWKKKTDSSIFITSFNQYTQSKIQIDSMKTSDN